MENLILYRVNGSILVVRNGRVTKLAMSGKERKSHFRPDVLEVIGEKIGAGNAEILPPPFRRRIMRQYVE